MLFAGRARPHPQISSCKGIYSSTTCLSFASPWLDTLTVFRGTEPCKCHSTLHTSEPPKYAKTLSKPSVIFITPDDICQNTRAAVKLVKAVLSGGIPFVQVRDKHSSPLQVKRLVQALLTGGVPAHALAINGIAPAEVLAIDSHLGIHIKERDIGKLLPKANELMPSGSVIGCAVHSTLAAKQAIDIHEPSYLQVGTMYSTQSHPGKIPEGPGLLKKIRSVIGESPMLIGVGGINEDNLASVIEHGADGIAVITQLSNASDPRRESASLLNLCKTAYEAKRRE